MPSLFLSHGSPIHAAGGTRAARGWRALGQRLPRPQGVLVASAHWETELPMVSATAQPDTLHDFRGFPEPLHQIRYRAPGAVDAARRAVALLEAAGLSAAVNACRGLDHGAWAPLSQLWPDASVPVSQIALQPSLGAAHHLAMGRALEPLARDGILVLGSGQVTHNLREAFRWAAQESPLGTDTSLEPYAAAFRDWVRATLDAHDDDALLDWQERAPSSARAHPTPEHFLPLLVAYGAAGTRPRIEHLDFGAEANVIAMDGYVFG